ncbi:MAG: hypothetical protein V3V32_04390 [Dehalococcoidia bacterium]
MNLEAQAREAHKRNPKTTDEVFDILLAGIEKIPEQAERAIAAFEGAAALMVALAHIEDTAERKQAALDMILKKYD